MGFKGNTYLSISGVGDLDAFCDDAPCDPAGHVSTTGTGDSDGEARLVICPTFCPRYPYSCDEPSQWLRLLDDLRTDEVAANVATRSALTDTHEPHARTPHASEGAGGERTREASGLVVRRRGSPLRRAIEQLEEATRPADLMRSDLRGSPRIR